VRAKANRSWFWPFGAAAAWLALVLAIVRPMPAQFPQARAWISNSASFTTFPIAGSASLTEPDLHHRSRRPLPDQQPRGAHFHTAGEFAPGGAVTNLVALAPACFLDTSNRLVLSTGRLELLGLQRRLTVKGDEGFLFYLTNSTLIVSNHVRTYIHPELLRSAAP
jgi:hypothetical protein